MRVEGRWHLFDDSVLRPVIDASLQTPAGAWQRVTLLLDAGADRTVFEARFLSLFSSSVLPPTETPELGGVGGKVDCVFVQARLAFTRDDDKQVFINGPFGIFINPASSDISVLGRDVTNNFDVIYSYPRRQVTLLALPHSYQIQPSF
jgi:hypothetical protein